MSRIVHVLATAPFVVALGMVACGRTDLAELDVGVGRDPIGAGPGDASGGYRVGSLGDAGAGDASIAWCDAGGPRAFTLANVTCGLFLRVPCGLPPDFVPEPSGLLTPDECGLLCPTDRSWESCSVYGGDGSTGPDVVVVCVPDCT